MIYLQTLIDGILMGGVYAMIAVGLSLAFGVMKIVNFAHGECLMFGMYVSFIAVKYLGIDPYITIFISGFILFGFGYIIQKFIFNKMLKHDEAHEPISILLFTCGLALAMSSLAIIIFTSYPFLAETAYSGKTILLGDLIISIPRLISFVLSVLFTVLLYVFLQKSDTGRALRALSQNRHVAHLMGINVEKLYCLAFGIGLGLVGIAGALLTPYFPVSPTVGLTFGMRSFIIVVLGGSGSVIGSLIGGLIIGIIEKVGGLIVSDVYAQLIIFGMFIAVLLFKPNGLLSKERD